MVSHHLVWSKRPVCRADLTEKGGRGESLGRPSYSPRFTGQTSGAGMDLVTEDTMVILMTGLDFNRHRPLLCSPSQTPNGSLFHRPPGSQNICGNSLSVLPFSL